MRREPSPDTVYTLTFDCYGTLIDWKTGIEQAARAIASLAGCDLERLVRDREQTERDMQRGPYRPYGEVLATSLVHAARVQAIDVSLADARTFADSMPSWPPFAESHAALNRLATRYQLAILSNVETRVLEASVRLLDAPFEELVTAEQLESYKPAPAHFDAAAERLGLERRRILHVAVSVYHDLRTASAQGFPVAWVNRDDEEPPQDLALDLIVPDLTTLARELGC